MLVMAQKHRVDRADFVRRDRRAAGLLQSHARGLINARLAESRIGEEAQSGQFDEDGRAADQGQPGFKGWHQLLSRSRAGLASRKIGADALREKPLGCADDGSSPYRPA
jgi:hypothetical protein